MPCTLIQWEHITMSVCIVVWLAGTAQNPPTHLPPSQQVISDLLKPDKVNLMIREDRRRGVFVDGLSEWVVRSPAEVYGLMMRGAQQVCVCVWMCVVCWQLYWNVCRTLGSKWVAGGSPASGQSRCVCVWMCDGGE